MDASFRRTADWTGWLEAIEGELASRGSESLERTAMRLLDRARLGIGEEVVDLGAGTGLIALKAALTVGPSGRVTAVDADPGCLYVLASRAADAGLRNLEVVRGTLEAIPIDSGSLDAALCRSAFSYSTDLERAVSEARRVLRPRGRFSIFEPLLGELEWDGRIGGDEEEFRAMEQALKSSGGPRSVVRSLLRDAFTTGGFECDSLLVHNVLSMKGASEEEIADEYLNDLPGGLSAFNVLKSAGFVEKRTVEVARAFSRAASAGEIRGRLACLFMWGSRRV